MSIETLLTLGVAVAILVGAALLRVVVLGLLAVGLRLAGRDTGWLHPARPVSGAPVRNKKPRSVDPGLLRHRSAVAGRGAMLAIATIATWLRAAASGLGRVSRASYRWLAPQADRAWRGLLRGVVAAARWVAPRAVVVLATIHHLLQIGYDHIASWWTETRASRGSREEPRVPQPRPESNVIRLDDDWDPLTDDFPEDFVTLKPYDSLDSTTRSDRRPSPK